MAISNKDKVVVSPLVRAYVIAQSDFKLQNDEAVELLDSNLGYKDWHRKEDFDLDVWLDLEACELIFGRGGDNRVGILSVSIGSVSSGESYSAFIRPFGDLDTDDENDAHHEPLFVRCYKHECIGEEIVGNFHHTTTGDEPGELIRFWIESSLPECLASIIERRIGSTKNL